MKDFVMENPGITFLLAFLLLLFTSDLINLFLKPKPDPVAICVDKASTHQERMQCLVVKGVRT